MCFLNIGLFKYYRCQQLYPTSLIYQQLYSCIIRVNSCILMLFYHSYAFLPLVTIVHWTPLNGKVIKQLAPSLNLLTDNCLVSSYVIKMQSHRMGAVYQFVIMISHCNPNCELTEIYYTLYKYINFGFYSPQKLIEILKKWFECHVRHKKKQKLM